MKREIFGFRKIGNVIHVNFKPDQLMTKGELHAISKRIDEIDAALDLCDPDHDADVIENLHMELDYHERNLERSLDSKPKRKKGSK